MKNKLNTKNRIYIILIVVILTIVSSIFLINNKLSDNKTQLDEVKLKDIKDNNMFAIMVKENGEYTSSDKFPGDGYKFNSEKSGCMDNNNQLIPDSLSYDEGSQQVIVNTGQTSYCYLYFDKQLSVADLEKYDKTNTLSNELVGGMYRYQGTNSVVQNNYICLGKLNDEKCGDKNSNMYRIIGITENGNIKVMKLTSMGAKKWNTNYHVGSSSSGKCDTSTGCPEWPDSEIFKTLNGETDSFLNTLNESIKEKIEPQKWYYGDIGWNYSKTLGVEDTYKIESGQKETQYYNAQGTLVTDQKWKQMDEPASIGLIYLHDYYYQANQESCQSDKNSNYAYCQTKGWMHMKNNGGATSGNEIYEWTMSRIGRWSSSDTNFYAWLVTSSGDVNDGTLNYAYAVRPVFYLKSDIELGGAGSTSDPFYIKS